MARIFSVLLLLIVTQYGLKAQVVPKEGSGLHYRLIGFSFPAVRKAKEYKLEIASGYYQSQDSFNTHIVRTIAVKTNRAIAEVPFFGREYTWRYAVAGDESGLTAGDFHHFKTVMSEDVDSLVRLRIIKEAEVYKDALVFLDGNNALYDMKGKPVWYLPKKIKDLGRYVMDVKLTPQGTITFLCEENAYEISYDGTILWKAPNNGRVSGDETEYYHHEFTRLGNGHYMILGRQLLDMPSGGDGTMVKMPFGTIIEYDKDGKVVWSWKSTKYCKESDLKNYKTSKTNPIIDHHENGFFFDEKNKVIYLSFKHLSRVIKIKYPEGNVLNTYGDLYLPDGQKKDNQSFCFQHSPKYSQLGCLFLYNNNGCTPGGLPKVKKFQEPTSDTYPLKKVWEYECTVDGDYSKVFAFGGSVDELPDQSLFVCMGSQYSKLFIVNSDKKILWSALPEKFTVNDKKWNQVTQYRASMITDRKQLEQLIWYTESERE